MVGTTRKRPARLNASLMGRAGRADGGEVQRRVVKRDYPGNGKTAIFHRPAAPPLGIGNREWGIGGMGNDAAGGGGGEKNAVGCRVGRSSSPIPHSRLPIPKGGAVGRGRFPIPDCRFP